MTVQPTNILDPGAGWSQLTGHAAVHSLTGRYYHVSHPEWTPHRTECWVFGLPCDDMHERSSRVDSDGRRHDTSKFWGPGDSENGHYTEIFQWMTKQVLGRPMRQSNTIGNGPADIIDRRGLFKLAQWLVESIDQSEARDDHYPDGWRGWYDLIKHGREKVEPNEKPTAAPSPALRLARHGVLSTVDWIATDLGWTERQVLDAADIPSRQAITAASEPALLMAYNDEVARRVKG